MNDHGSASPIAGVPIGCHLSRALADAIAARRSATGESLGHIVRAALAQYLEVDHATLFQVSTAGALVEGLYQGEVTVGVLKAHGDLGLGTFDGLDGEMVIVDGRVYQVTADGVVREVQDEVQTPFALVSRFHPEQRTTIARCDSLATLEAALDRLRASDNHFYAIRIDGAFARVRTRAVRRAADGTPLAEAAAEQSEFALDHTIGTLVRFWAPAYAGRLTVPGYHLHYVTDDRRSGGHLFDCGGTCLGVMMQHLADFHLSLPESAAFLRADLSRDPATDLSKAERSTPEAAPEGNARRP